MKGKKLGISFFKWCGKNVDNSIKINELHGKYTYVRTIGISIFNKGEGISDHFGPLRLSLRVLYNLGPVESDDLFIEVLKRRHLWREDPLFIFDDTLLHRSVNGSDELRYCAFIDIVRPSRFSGVLSALITTVQLLVYRARHVFYQNWSPI